MPRHRRRAAARHSKQAAAKMNPWVIAALVLIVASALAYQIWSAVGPSYLGDDSVYTMYAYIAAHGHFVQNGDIFTVRLLNIFPIALSYVLFGVNALSSALWAIFSFLGCIVIAFLLGKELYNDYAGLLAALLVSVMPLMVVYSGTPTPNIPEAFLTGLAILALVYGHRRNSKRWYFASGAILVLSVLATPASAYIFPFAAVYLIAGILSKSIKADRTLLYLVYGIIIAGLCLMAFNYVNSGNPLITIRTTASVYSTAGTPKEGILIDQNLNFYPNIMFPYRVMSVLAGVFKGNISPSNMWKDIYLQNYNYVGFYFYAVIACIAYLALAREKRAYLPVLWLILTFLVLEFGPIYIALHPFKYILTHRLDRYLQVIAIPLALTISFAAVNAAEWFARHKMKALMAIPAALMIFLIVTAIPLSLSWHSILRYETYDQRAIAGYLNALPNSTRVYMESGFSIMQVFMHYDNMSRFYIYDGIRNCSQMEAGSYVVIPKYISAFGLNYTPDPTRDCPSWNLVLYPQEKGNYSQYIVAPATPFGAKLYYIPLPNSSTQSGSRQSIATTATTTIQQGNASVAPQGSQSNFTHPVYGPYNYFNLTGVGIINNTTGKLTDFVVVNNVTWTSITLNRTEAAPGQMVHINVTFHGNINFNGSYAFLYYVFSQPELVNNHYFGVEYINETGNLTVQSNGPWYYFFSQIPSGKSYTYVPSNLTLRQQTPFRVEWNVTPTPNVTGKMLKFCAGFFASYSNDTQFGSWANAYDTLARHQTRWVNKTVINIPGNCAFLKVG